MSESPANDWQEACLQASRELHPERRMAIVERLRRIVRKETHKFGSLRVDFANAEVRRNGNLLYLSNLEFRLLRYLIAQAGAIVSREELLRAVWAYDKRVFTRTVDVHICSLRQKVENDTSRPKLILTVKGEGYKFAGYKFRAGRRDT